MANRGLAAVTALALAVVPAAALARQAGAKAGQSPAAAASPDQSGQSNLSKDLYEGVNDAGRALHKGAGKVVDGIGGATRELLGTDKKTNAPATTSSPAAAK